MRFMLKIDNYDNAAMQDGDEAEDETARILERAARKIREGARSGSLLDTNGNSVGSFEFIDDD